MKNLKPAFILVTASTLLISGCGTFKSYFPDKEKDYQFAQEIPPLDVPQDLAHNEIAKRKIYQEIEPESENVFMIADEPSSLEMDNSSEIIHEEPQEIIETQATEINLIRDISTVRLRINTGFSSTWRMVSKALTRQMLEISQRNQGEKFFIVQYDPNATDFKDETVLDELAFVFGDDHSQEKPYKVQLLESETNTDVIILNELDQPLADGAGLSLLNRIHKTLKTDLNTQ